MGIYDDFAEFYASGSYPQHSLTMAGLFLQTLDRFGLRPQEILDIACGEGSFAVAMAEMGLGITGLDISSRMLDLARSRAKEAGVSVEFIRRDMRELTFRGRFDLATCWYDSLNYLLDPADLEKTFVGVAEALKPGGAFLFDMNTRYGLFVGWQRHPCHLQRDTADMLEIHRPRCDCERERAILSVTGFKRNGDYWVRIDEEHVERAYAVEEIRSCLVRSGFSDPAFWGNLRDLTELKPDSPRVYCLARKP